jgi:hypothetical protein
MKSRIRYGEETGMTIMEALVASALLALVIASVSLAIINGHRAILFARLHGAAHELAFDYAWETFNWDYKRLVNVQTNPVRFAVSEEHPDHLLGPYGGTVRIATLDHTNAVEIQVQVNWNQRGADGAIPSSQDARVLRAYSLRRPRRQ